MKNSVFFYLNGEPVTVTDPSPDLLLIDYLRSPEVSLTGAKKGCGEGGCGACTVILSRWNECEKTVEHRSINSCLRPVCALGGLAVTTVEGTGAAAPPAPAHVHHAPIFGRSAAPADIAPYRALERMQAKAAVSREKMQEISQNAASLSHGAQQEEALDQLLLHQHDSACQGVNPVAHRLAMNNGTQCGYCTVGFVMTMSAFLANNPRPTKRQIEDAFDGNICRCIGYRPILTGMKTFACDWSPEDEANRMKCKAEEACDLQLQDTKIAIPFPAAARAPAEPVSVQGSECSWLTPTSLDELYELMRSHQDRKIRLVHGNTSFGIYPSEFREAALLLDIRLIPELSSMSVEENEIRAAAGVSYSELIEVLDKTMEAREASPTSRLGAAHFMARRTAGGIVRNAASLAGNSMLVLEHIYQGEPFPSDLFTALAAIDAEIVTCKVSTGAESRSTVAELVGRVVKDPELASDLVIIRYHIPYGSSTDIVQAQKVALREVNSHSVVNSTTRFELSQDLVVDDAVLVFGGIAPYPWRASETEAAMRGKPLDLQQFAEFARVLENEVSAVLNDWQERMDGLIWEGFENTYKVKLATSFLYKAMVNALLSRDASRVPPEARSSGEITWGRWPVSDGTQKYETQAYKAPVSEPFIKMMAMYQASGQVRYTHEIEVPPTAVNAAFVQSRRALADYHYVVPDQGSGSDTATADDLRAHLLERFPAFVDLVTHEQIPPHGKNPQGMGFDQPLLAEDRVSYVGQAIALVLADSEQHAIDIADYVTEHCVGYSEVDWQAPWNEPVLSLERAIEMGSVFPDNPKSSPFVSHIWEITRPGSQFDWATEKGATDRTIVKRQGSVDGVPCQIVESTQSTGGQVHFYMETQSCVGEPADGKPIVMRPSSQSPMEMHQTTAMALGVEYNHVDVRIGQVGGAYGGKTEQARFVTGPTAVAANYCQRPVRLVMPRAADTAMIGKRHPYYGQYQIAVDRGEARAEDKGIIRGFHTKMWGDDGAFYDCSFIVSNCIQLRADSAYRVRNFESQIDVCRTNKAPNTAFRSFGDVQYKLIVENAIDDAAFALGMCPEELRGKNLYERGDVTPFGQALSYCYIKDVWAYLKEQCDFEGKKCEVEEFNHKNKWRKRGISMIPVKYGSGYNLTMLEQAVAVISVYSSDGSIVIYQGGVDMGQGLMTKVEQVAAYILNVPMELIRVEGPNTGVTPNPTSTGGSTGTAYNGEAVKRACEQLRSRLIEFGYSLLKDNGDDWCKKRGIDFWNFGEDGWKSVTEHGSAELVWQNLVLLAYQNRVDLVAHFTAPIPGSTTPVPAMQFKPKDQQPKIPGIAVDSDAPIGGPVDSFVGFTFSAACSVVETDILTGEIKILSSDLVYDMGWSLNPALDVGQVEGAFIQGVGYLLTENLVFQPDGPEKGRLNTLNTWRYKPPAITTIPLQMNVYLFPRDLASDVPENPNGLLSSKEVGEPPLVLANSVFFALKAAIRASRLERSLDGLFRLDAPATVQEVCRACAVSVDDLSS